MTALRWLEGVRWVSFEPLSFDAAPILRETGVPFEWAVIGAASNGSKKYQPHPEHVQGLLDVLDENGVAVWMKNNLEWEPRRRERPQTETQRSHAR